MSKSTKLFPNEVSTILHMLGISFTVSRGEFHTKFARRHEEGIKLTVSKFSHVCHRLKCTIYRFRQAKKQSAGLFIVTGQAKKALFSFCPEKVKLA